MPGAEESKAFLTSMTSIGSKILGSAGGILAVLTAGTPIAGIIVTPIIAYNLEKMGKDLIGRQISPRQHQRVAAVYVVSHRIIEAMLNNGCEQRDDDFFTEGMDGRSAAEEVTEAFFAAARDASEEKKLVFVAQLLAYIFFDKLLDASTSHFFINLADRLTYRSFAILSLVGSDQNYHKDDVEPSQMAAANMDAALSETVDLISSGFLEMKDSRESTTSSAVLGADDIDPNKLYLSSLGKVFYDAMKLGAMLPDDKSRSEMRDIFQCAAQAKRGSTAVDGGTF